MSKNRVWIRENPVSSLPGSLGRIIARLVDESSDGIKSSCVEGVVCQFMASIPQGMSPYPRGELIRMAYEAIAWIILARQKVVYGDTPTSAYTIGQTTYILGKPQCKWIHKSFYWRKPPSRAGRYLEAMTCGHTRHDIVLDARRWLEGKFFRARQIAGLGAGCHMEYRFAVSNGLPRESMTVEFSDGRDFRKLPLGHEFPAGNIKTISIPAVALERVRNHGLQPSKGIIPLDVARNNSGEWYALCLIGRANGVFLAYTPIEETRMGA